MAKVKRYSDKQKEKILRDVENYNRRNGRGGLAYAVKKYGITFNTLRAWQENSYPAIKPLRSPADVTPKSASVIAKVEKSLKRIETMEIKLVHLENLIIQEKSAIKSILGV